MATTVETLWHHFESVEKRVKRLRLSPPLAFKLYVTALDKVLRQAVTFIDNYGEETNLQTVHSMSYHDCEGCHLTFEFHAGIYPGQRAVVILPEGPDMLHAFRSPQEVRVLMQLLLDAAGFNGQTRGQRMVRADT